MDFRFASRKLENVWKDPQKNSLGHGESVDEKFCERIRIIKNAEDERDIRVLKALRYERLKGKRKNQWSIRLNDQWRLIIQWEKTKAGKRAVIVEVVDYH